MFDTKAHSAPLHDVLPSPDGQRAAIFSGDKLFIVTSDGETHQILSKITEDNEYYFPNIQWSPNSQYFYMTRGKGKRDVNMIKNEQTLSLMKIEMTPPYSLVDFIDDFRAITYFLIGNESVCYNYAPGDGSLQWRCMLNNEIHHMNSIDKNEVILGDGLEIQEKPFVTCRGILCGPASLSKNGYHHTANGNQEFFLRKGSSEPIFTVKTGINSLKGISVDGILWDRSVVLPGGRYVLLDIYHDKFKGQIMVDSSERIYQELPKYTKIYYNLNSWNYDTSLKDKIMGPMFIPREISP